MSKETIYKCDLCGSKMDFNEKLCDHEAFVLDSTNALILSSEEDGTVHVCSDCCTVILCIKNRDIS